MVLAAVCALFGCTLLALGQERHRKVVASSSSAYRLPTARWAGSALLVVALASGIRDAGPSFGVLLWPLLVAGASLITAAILCWRPRWLRALAWCLGRIDRRHGRP